MMKNILNLLIFCFSSCNPSHSRPIIGADFLKKFELFLLYYFLNQTLQLVTPNHFFHVSFCTINYSHKMVDHSNPHAFAGQVARVALRLPPFWPRNVRVWQLQVEAQFALCNIVNEQTKYHHVLSILPPETADLLSNFLVAPLTATPYTDLMNRLIAEFEESAVQKTQKILSGLDLGDRKPSQLLRELRTASNGHIDDEFLRNIFIQRLPTNIRPILATSTENLDNLAILADKLVEFSSPSFSICSTLRLFF